MNKISSLIFLLLTAAMILVAPMAQAQEILPGNACTAGQNNRYTISGGPATGGVTHLMMCNGSTWLSRMTWSDTSTSNIGIKQSAPQYQLDMGSTPLSVSRIRSPGNPLETMIDLGNNDLSFRTNNLDYIKFRSTAPHMIIGDTGTDNNPNEITFGQSHRVYISNVTGQVAINTNTPTTPLTVSGIMRLGSGISACTPGLAGTVRFKSTAPRCVELCSSGTWSCIYAEACTEIAATANFAYAVNAAVNTIIESAIAQPSGITGCTVDVRVIGDGNPQYRTCADSACATVLQTWTSAVTPITGGEWIQLRLTSSPSGGVIRNALLIIGGGHSTWRVLSADNCANPDPAPGSICPDGTVYIGRSPDGNAKMYTTCGSYGNTFNGVSCIGSSTSIRFSSGQTIATGITNPNTGESNTTALAALSNADAPYTAAVTCNNLVESGQSDWYLPALNEAALFQYVCDFVNDIPCSNSVYRWSSTESSASAVNTWRNNGLTSTTSKSTTTFMRCVRRD